MASAVLCELHGHFKFLLHHRCIASPDLRYILRHRPVWSCVANFSTCMYRKRVKTSYKSHTIVSQQHMLRINTSSFTHLTQQQNLKLIKHKCMLLTLPCLQLMRYSSGNSHSDTDGIVTDINDEYFAEEMESENKIENENGMQKYNDDDMMVIEGNIDYLTGFETDWVNEWEEIKTMFSCSDEKMLKLLMCYPRMKNVELVKRVKVNMRILLEKGVSERKAFSLLLSSKGTFLQVSPYELSTLFPEGRIRKTWYHDLRSHMESSLKFYEDIDNIKFICELLDVKHDLIVKLTPFYGLKYIEAECRTVLLKEKVDFLLSEGLSSKDIAYNLEILIIPMTFMGRTIDEMKATVGQVSIQILKSKYETKLNQRYRSTLSKAPILLDCSINTFSKLQRKFLNNINQTDAINVIDYLLDRDIVKVEIVKNPYVLGYRLERVRECFEKHVNTCDAATLDGQKKLLNLIVYNLDYGDSTV